MTIAPALTIGLNGRFECGSTTIALNALPDGSTPTCPSTNCSPWSSSAIPNTNGLEIDWIVKPRSASPTVKTCPSTVTSAMPNHDGSARPNSGM